MTERKNLKVTKETYDLLKEDKPSGVTWDYYLQRLKESTEPDGPECPECGSNDVAHAYGDAPNEEFLECRDCGHNEHFRGDR